MCPLVCHFYNAIFASTNSITKSRVFSQRKRNTLSSISASPLVNKLSVNYLAKYQNHFNAKDYQLFPIYWVISQNICESSGNKRGQKAKISQSIFKQTSQRLEERRCWNQYYCLIQKAQFIVFCLYRWLHFYCLESSNTQKLCSPSS